LPDVALGAIGFAASGVPLLRDASVPSFHVCGLPAGVIRQIETSDVHATLVPSLLFGVAAFLCAAAVARRRAGSGVLRYLDELPLAASALFVAAIASVGFSTFETSMALHGPLADVSRHQFCWLSALLAAAGAVLAIGCDAVARSLRESFDDVAEFVLSTLRLALATPGAQPKLGPWVYRPLTVWYRAAESSGSRAPPFS
jgi:hypothetical protein